MIVILNEYLSRLKALESAQSPDKRREIPTITALAEEIGVSRVQLQRLASNGTEGIQFDVGGKIIKAMRERGFQMDITDLLEYHD